MVRATVQIGGGEIIPGIYSFNNSQQFGRGGPFKHLLRRVVVPGLKYLGKKALSTGSKVASDVIEGENFKESMRKRFKETKEDTLNDLKNKLRGNGSRKRKRSTKKKQKSIKKKGKRKKTTDIFSE